MKTFKKLKPSLKFVTYTLPIRANKPTIWEAIKKFGEIASFHDNVVNSDYLDDSEFEVGCERYCEFHPQIGLKPVVKERIIDINNDTSYLIEFFAFKNFPMRYMYVELEVQELNAGECMTTARCWYRNKPKFLTDFFESKMTSTMREILLGYKHFVETNERNVKMAVLRNKYANL